MKKFDRKKGKDDREEYLSCVLKKDASWNAFAMAVHLEKFVEKERAMTKACNLADQENKTKAIALQKIRRNKELDRQRQKILVSNSILDAGYENWKKNRIRVRNRLKRDIQFELNALARKESRQRNALKAQVEDLEQGCNWFENNMDRLGLSDEKVYPTTHLSVVNEHRMEEMRQELSSFHALSAEYMENLQTKSREAQAAGEERERRRLRQISKQSNDQKQYEQQQVYNALNRLFLGLYRLELFIHLKKWQKTCSKIKKTQQVTANSIALKTDFELKRSVAIEQFCTKARSAHSQDCNKIQQIKRLALKKKHQKAFVVAQDTVNKLFDLASVVMSHREHKMQTKTDCIVALEEWPALKQRFVSPQPFFEIATTNILTRELSKHREITFQTEAMLTSERRDFIDNTGAWTCRPHPLNSIIDPTRDALAISREIISLANEEEPPFELKSKEAKLRFCITGNIQKVWCTDIGLAHVVTLEDSVELAVVTSLALQLNSDDTSALFVELATLGEAVVERRENNEPLEDTLLVDIVTTYLKTLDDTSWLLCGFPQTLLQAKLLENKWSNFTDADIDTALADQKTRADLSAKQKADRKKALDSSSRKKKGGTTAQSSKKKNTADSSRQTSASKTKQKEKQPSESHSQQFIPNFVMVLGQETEVSLWWCQQNYTALRRTCQNRAQFHEQLIVAVEACEQRLNAIEATFEERSTQSKRRNSRSSMQSIPSVTKALPAMPAKARRPSEMSQATETPQEEAIQCVPFELEVSALHSSKLANLSTTERLRRDQLVGECVLDLDNVHSMIDTWQKEESMNSNVLDAFIHELHEQNVVIEKAKKEAVDSSALASSDTRWDAARASAATKFTQATSAEQNIGIIDDLELSLGDVVDLRKKEATAIVQRVIEHVAGTVDEAVSRLALLSTLLLNAEASKFRSNLKFLDDYKALIGTAIKSRTSIDETEAASPQQIAHLSTCLKNINSELTALPEDLAMSLSAAIELALPYTAQLATPGILVIVCEYARRLTSVVTRFKAASNEWRSTSNDLKTSLEDMTIQRYRLEHTAVSQLATAARDGSLSRKDLVTKSPLIIEEAKEDEITVLTES